MVNRAEGVNVTNEPGSALDLGVETLSNQRFDKGLFLEQD